MEETEGTRILEDAAAKENQVRLSLETIRALPATSWMRTLSSGDLPEEHPQRIVLEAVEDLIDSAEEFSFTEYEDEEHSAGEGSPANEQAVHLVDQLMFLVQSRRNLVNEIASARVGTPAWDKCIERVVALLLNHLNCSTEEAQQVVDRLNEKKRDKEATRWDPMSAFELSCMPLVEQETVWKGYIGANGNFVLLGGEPKGGKDWFLAGLMNAIAEGQKFLGIPTTQTTVLYVSNEERLQAVQRRLRRFKSTSRNLYLVSIAGERWDAKFKAELTKNVQRTGARLVVLNTLSRLWTVESENDAAQTSAELQSMLQWAQDNEVTLMLVHHLRKPQNGGSNGSNFGAGVLTLHDMRGSGDIVSAFDDILLLSRVKVKKSDPERWLAYYGRTEGEAADNDAIKIKLNLESMEYSVVEGWMLPKDQAGKPAESESGAKADGLSAMAEKLEGSAKLREYLTSGGTFETQRSLADDFSVDEGTVRNQLKILKGEGWQVEDLNTHKRLVQSQK